MSEWITVHYPISLEDQLPPERKCVLVWCQSSHIPWVGYLRYAAGCYDSPFFVVPHGNDCRAVDVIAWCDCLRQDAPPGFVAMPVRGFPAVGPDKLSEAIALQRLRNEES
jgi:hypothetical protein